MDGLLSMAAARSDVSQGSAPAIKTICGMRRQKKNNNRSSYKKLNTTILSLTVLTPHQFITAAINLFHCCDLKSLRSCFSTSFSVSRVCFLLLCLLHHSSVLPSTSETLSLPGSFLLQASPAIHHSNHSYYMHRSHSLN